MQQSEMAIKESIIVFSGLKRFLRVTLDFYLHFILCCLTLTLTFFRASEGKTVEVLYKGPVELTMKDVLGGVRSTCTYVGAAKLKELSRRTTFIRVTQQLNTVFGNDD